MGKLLVLRVSECEQLPLPSPRPVTPPGRFVQEQFLGGVRLPVWKEVKASLGYDYRSGKK